MKTPDISHLHARTAPAPADAADTQNPNTLAATLRAIGHGSAADGQPWPEHAQQPGRQRALAGLRVVQEIMLAAERTRQNGEVQEHVGDRVMEGLMLASIGLCAQVSAQLQPR
ncbi:hypothetical protein [Stenotrophomonas sp.]|uniref:hypothetical protein n=1 Tax=Stenotrophomonas sp. TaxID=69392 RepID=UPI0031E316E2